MGIQNSHSEPCAPLSCSLLFCVLQTMSSYYKYLMAWVANQYHICLESKLLKVDSSTSTLDKNMLVTFEEYPLAGLSPTKEIVD